MITLCCQKQEKKNLRREGCMRERRKEGIKRVKEESMRKKEQRAEMAEMGANMEGNEQKDILIKVHS